MMCQNPRCMMPASARKKFQDPRRGDKEPVYIERFICSYTCEEELIEELERQAQYARLVS